MAPLFRFTLIRRKKYEKRIFFISGVAVDAFALDIAPLIFNLLHILLN
jgi:hypothetical protein